MKFGIQSFLLMLATTAAATAADPQLLSLSGNLGTHDPAIIKQGDTYYLFCTGGRRRRNAIPVRVSQDLKNWTRAGHVLDELPDWVQEEIPKARNAWAPDISFFNGKYHLYYSLSSFGVNESAIALATNATLDPDDPADQWIDQGIVVRSRTGEDDFNAIDPNVVIEGDGKVWLSWGSFWGGIMMRRIDPNTGKLSTADTRLYKLASRQRDGQHQTPPVEGAIEAPFIVRHDDYWYLFVSWDFCCRGPRSDYKVVVGRSPTVTGPYVDKDSTPLSEGGGTLLIEAATDKWRGAGHPAVSQDGKEDYLLVHSYTADRGNPQLQISTIKWENGWPRVAPLP